MIDVSKYLRQLLSTIIVFCLAFTMAGCSVNTVSGNQSEQDALVATDTYNRLAESIQKNGTVLEDGAISVVLNDDTDGYIQIIYSPDSDSFKLQCTITKDQAVINSWLIIGNDNAKSTELGGSVTGGDTTQKIICSIEKTGISIFSDVTVVSCELDDYVQDDMVKLVRRTIVQSLEFLEYYMQFNSIGSIQDLGITYKKIEQTEC